MDQTDLTINKVLTVHNLYPELAGENMQLSLKERLFDTTDIDFKGRCFEVNRTQEEMSTHATIMASIAVGAGNSGPKGKGVAWKANITSSSYADLFPDDHVYFKANNISVQNHSYGVGEIENYYGLEAQKYDKECIANPNILHVFSSGNSGSGTSKTGIYQGIEGFANLTAQFKTSKNSLCIGEIDNYGNVKELSSKGPAFDGRVKPELVAFGFQGSSESAAMVSGIALLVQEAYKNRNDNILPAASLVKAILINSADDMGNPEVDFKSGFGSVDALGAIKTVEEERFMIDTISNGETKTFKISVPENARKLKITIAWHDPQAEAGTEKALINNLDLGLTELSSSDKWEPWILNPFPHIDSLKQNAKRGKDYLNNVEQITVDFPNPGDYEINVFGYSIQGSQNYSLAYEYENSFQWLNPLKKTIFRAGEKIQIRWKWMEHLKAGMVEYQLINQKKWQTIDNSYNLSEDYIDWLVPEINSLAQIRIKTTEKEFLSDTFLISKPNSLSVGMNCNEEAMIFWKPQNDAENYQLYRLGNKFIEPYITIQDTFKILTNNELDFQNYSVSPIINGHVGLRSKTINYTTQNIDCYFVRFVSKQAITDSVLLDLELASTYKLTALDLERYSENGFSSIQRIESFGGNKYLLYDEKPNPNRNIYRVRLERDDFTEVLSQEESVYFNPAGNVLVYPNPVRSNEPINIIDGEDGVAQIKIFNSEGKLCYKSETSHGKLKKISTNNFKQGIYHIEYQTDKGHKSLTKVIVL